MLPLPRSRGLQLGLLVALAWILWSAWVHRGHWVDDAFISFRYAANWLAGDGLVFNPGERVEGVTNLGWVWLVGVASYLLPGSIPVVAKVLGLLCLAGTLLLTTLAHRRLAPAASGAELALLPILIASSPELVYFSLAGMETGLAALLLGVGLWSLARERPRLAPAALAAGALFAVRPEAVVLFPLFVFWALLTAPGEIRRSRVLLGLGIFVLLVLAVTGFRLGYYGEPLPNTFLAKSAGTGEEIVRRGWEGLVGRHVNLPAPWVGSVLGLFGGAGSWALWRSAYRPAALFLVSGLATGVAFAVYAPADWTGMGRYFAPFVPFAALLGVRGLFAGFEALLGLAGRSDGAGPPRRAAVVAGSLATLLLAGVGLWRGRVHLSPEALGVYPGFVLASDTLIEPARRVGELVPAGATIATRRIGALGYFGRRPVLDYAFGLTDPEVARLRRGEGVEPFESPSADALAPVWAERPPECLLEDSSVIARLRVDRFSNELTVHGVVYRKVERFPVGDGSVEWLLACRPRSVRSPGAPPAAGGSTRAAGR